MLQIKNELLLPLWHRFKNFTGI